MNRAKPGLLQRRASEKAQLDSSALSATRAPEAPSLVHDVLRSPGQPLDHPTRDFMESRFGHDFSGVRLHTDAHADASARAVSADAYTVRDHLVFRSGNYSPHTESGRKLIAHELTHTVQQRGSSVGSDESLTIEPSTSEAEKQAVQSERLTAGPDSTATTRPASSFGPASLQRQPTPGEDPARYRQTHAALFTPPTQAGAAAGTPIPPFNADAQDTIKKQFEKWITDLRTNNPGAFAPDLYNNTDKGNADKSTVAMDQRLRGSFPQISQPIPEATLLSHISIIQDADVAKTDFLRMWLDEHLLVTDIANYQLGPKDPVYLKFLDTILGNKKMGLLVRELARHKGAYTEESPSGTREVHLNQGLDSSQRDITILHELVHFYAHATYRAWVDTTSNPRFFNEGFTEILARKAMTPAQLKANGKPYQDRVDQIEKDISPRIPEDDLARAYFAGEVWRIEFQSNDAKKAFKDQTNLDPAAKASAEKKQAQTSAGIVETVTPGGHYRFMNLGEETAGPKPEHKAFFATLATEIIKDPTTQLRFVGHASSAGNKSAREKRSLAQVTAFYKMARDAGIPEAQLPDAKALPHFGGSQPTTGNDDVIGRAFNRRVELFITHTSAAANPVPVAPLQKKSPGTNSSLPNISPIETARAGLRGAAAPLPYVGEIQRSFGRHFIGDIKTATGGPAETAARSIGSVAYAMGDAIAFARSPDLATAAHEAAHVVQQRRGVTLPGGLGSTGDGFEKHADAVSSLVTRGASAEAALDQSPGSGGDHLGVQRLAFVNETQVKKGETGLTAAMKGMVSDTPVRNYLTLDEFKKHADKSTDYLGNLKDGTWVRFSPTGTNLLGENHTQVTLEESVGAVGSKSFIYEPFSSDKMAAGSNFESAYAGETAGRFKLLGVDKVKDKQPFGAESLLPKMGFNLTILQPYFDGTSDLNDLKSGDYIGQPTQRYLKIAWGWSKDNQLDVDKKTKAGEFVPPKFKKLADVHTAVTAKLDPFITKLKVDGHLGDELGKKANLPLLPLLADFGRAFSEAMMRVAAESPSSRLSMGGRLALTGSSVTSEKDKLKMFTEWRDFMFEDNVAVATKRGVRYAGMGQAHLDHLVKIGLDKAQHPFEMEGKDIADFKSLTDKLKKAASGKP